ncbi:hypothetical protein EUX98_g2076 [Antrodiella citrinella]|uniref:ARM repeat-containing protein n=1 Tax=Antrodiella citrinella TaxID=2447956 RepID=A0A4S4N284_9APHY|nr:hypothetical protein EUX98_g2076 [Antrodiella citrinella]
MNSPLYKASELGNLRAKLPLNPSQDEQWNDIEATARSLANDLRVKDVEQQTALAKTLLPQTLSGLLKAATAGTPTPDPKRKMAISESSSCFRRTDEGRASLLEAGFPQAVVSLLEGYSDTIKLNETGPMELSMLDLLIVKTAIGVLLNSSLGYEPVKTRLISLEAAMTILKLSIAIYPPGSWLKGSYTPLEGNDESAAVKATWDLRSNVTSWTWSVISEWEDTEDNEPRPLFTADILPHLSRTLQAFVPPYPSPPPSFPTTDSWKAYAKVDLDVIEEVSGQLESLALDVEEVKLALSREYVSSTDGDSVLSRMLTFVEHGDYPPYWSGLEEEDAWRKGFDRCKAAVIKAVVEVAGDDKNIDVLWDDPKSQDTQPSEFVHTMIRWIRAHKYMRTGGRDDLLVCALVNLGNLCRREAHSIAIVNAPIALLPDFVSMLEPETDLKIMHGLLGLLKHLATAPANRTPIGRAGVLRKLLTSQSIHSRTDAVEHLQLSAIGLVKHLCSSNVDNSLIVCLPDTSASDEKSLLDRVLDLGQRSNVVAIKSESTRVAVNIIKSLWTVDIASSEDPETFQQKRDVARRALVTPHCAAALAQLIGRSRKYPMLVNEGVVALTLLSTGDNGGAIALDALMNPLPVEVGSNNRQPSLPPMSAGGILSDAWPTTSEPQRAFDMLVSFIHNVPFKFQPTAHGGSTGLPTEVRANICSLLGHLGRKGVVINRERDVENLKESTKDLLEVLARDTSTEGGENNRSMKKMLGDISESLT